LIQLNASSLFVDKSKKKIMIGLDPNIFKSINKFEARKVFDIPADSKVIFAGSQYPSVERKGFQYFIESLEILSKKLKNETNNVIVLLAGNVSVPIIIPFELKFVGHLNESLLIKAYQSADLFLCSSIEDTGPLMINESILVGTPVVSFNIGGALDLVENMKTGYKAKLRDSEDLADGIYSVLFSNNVKLIDFTQNCRYKGMTICSSPAQVKQFTELFNN
jgi:glycosyltransferase involved in cell wall biosynthesis